MPGFYRPAARAFVFASVVALIADALLGALTMVTNVAGAGDAPWWITAHVVERSRWVVVALLIAALVARGRTQEYAETGEQARAAWRAIGLAVALGPLLWLGAGWIVQALIFTIADRWAIDGQIFLQPGYYRRLFVDYVPWLLAGVATIMASRHAS